MTQSVSLLPTAKRFHGALSDVAHQNMSASASVRFGVSQPPDRQSALFSAFYVHQMTHAKPEWMHELAFVQRSTSPLARGFCAIQMLSPFIGMPLRVHDLPLISNQMAETCPLYRVISWIRLPTGQGIRLVLSPWWRTTEKKKSVLLVVEYTEEDVMRTDSHTDEGFRAMAQTFPSSAPSRLVFLWMDFHALFLHHTRPTSGWNRFHNLMVGPFQMLLPWPTARETKAAIVGTSLLDPSVLVPEWYHVLERFVLDPRWCLLMSHSALQQKHISHSSHSNVLNSNATCLMIEFFLACTTTEQEDENRSFSSPMSILQDPRIKTSSVQWKRWMSPALSHTLIQPLSASSVAKCWRAIQQCSRLRGGGGSDEIPMTGKRHLSLREESVPKKHQTHLAYELSRRWRQSVTTETMHPAVRTWDRNWMTLAHACLETSVDRRFWKAATEEEKVRPSVTLEMDRLDPGFWTLSSDPRHHHHRVDDFFHVNWPSGTGKKLAILMAIHLMHSEIHLSQKQQHSKAPFVVVTSKLSLESWKQEIRSHFKPGRFTYHVLGEDKGTSSSSSAPHVILVSRDQVKHRIFRSLPAPQLMVVDQCETLRGMTSAWLQLLSRVATPFWIFLSRPGPESMVSDLQYMIPRSLGIRHLRLCMFSDRIALDEEKKTFKKSRSSSRSRSRSRSISSSPQKKRRISSSDHKNQKTKKMEFRDKKQELFQEEEHLFEAQIWWLKHVLEPRLSCLFPEDHGTRDENLLESKIPMETENVGGVTTCIRLVSCPFETSQEQRAYSALIRIHGQTWTDAECRRHLQGLVTGSDYTCLQHLPRMETELRQVNRKTPTAALSHFSRESKAKEQAWDTYYQAFLLVHTEQWQVLTETNQITPVAESSETGSRMAATRFQGSCHVCFEPVSFPLVTPCNHLFCVSCLLPWLDRRSTCPVCVQEIDQGKLARLDLLDSQHADTILAMAVQPVAWWDEDMAYTGPRSKILLLQRYLERRLTETKSALLVCMQGMQQMQHAEARLRTQIPFHIVHDIRDTLAMHRHGIRVFLLGPDKLHLLRHLNPWFEEVILTSPMPGTWLENMELLVHRNSSRRQHGFAVAYKTLFCIQGTHEEQVQMELASRLDRTPTIQRLDFSTVDQAWHMSRMPRNDSSSSSCPEDRARISAFVQRTLKHWAAQ